jgi:hypothetical protein
VSRLNVPSRLILTPRSLSVLGCPAAALGITTLLASVVSVWRSERAPALLLSEPVASVSDVSVLTIWLSASTRSVIAVWIALDGSEKPIVVGDPALVPVSLSVRPGAASVMVLEVDVRATPSSV